MSKHGGRRPGAGRKPIGQRRQYYYTAYPREQERILLPLTRLGYSSLSEAMQGLAADEWRPVVTGLDDGPVAVRRECTRCARMYTVRADGELRKHRCKPRGNSEQA